MADDLDVSSVGLPPRSLRLTRRAVRLRLWLWPAFSLVAICVLVSGVRTSQNLVALSKSGVILNAERTGSMSDSDGGDRIDVRFTFEGRTITGSQAVSNDFYQRNYHVPMVPVTVLPGDPDNFVIGPVTAESVDRSRESFGIGLAVFLVCAGGLLAAFEFRRARESLLLRFGQAVGGEITLVKLRTGDAQVSTVIEYAYAPESKRLTRTQELRGDQVAQFPVGRAVVVLHGGIGEKPMLLESLWHVELAN